MSGSTSIVNDSPPDDVSLFPSLALNSADVPGGLRGVPLKRKFVYLGFEWRPVHADCWECPIGYTLAVEKRYVRKESSTPEKSTAKTR